MVARRTFIKSASLAVLAASTSRIYVRDALAQQAPNSSGSEPARLKAPAGACDCHHHIYDAARFPVRAGSRVIPNARVEDYRLLQKRIGTSRNIVVTPIGFPATLAENLVTLDAIKQAGGNARGVAIINPTISNADLQTLHDGGVRGIRFSSTGGSVPAAISKEIEPLAKRVARPRLACADQHRGGSNPRNGGSLEPTAGNPRDRPHGPHPAAPGRRGPGVQVHTSSDRQGPHLGETFDHLR